MKRDKAVRYVCLDKGGYGCTCSLCHVECHQQERDTHRGGFHVHRSSSHVVVVNVAVATAAAATATTTAATAAAVY